MGTLKKFTIIAYFFVYLLQTSNTMAAKSRSAKYYAKNKRARKKKAATDKKINARPSQVKKRVEANRYRRKAKAAGKNVKGKDASHTKNGMRLKDSSANRGSKSDTAGDKRARGGKKKKKTKRKGYKKKSSKKRKTSSKRKKKRHRTKKK